MRRFFRILGSLAIAMILGLGALGLINEFRGLPAGTLDTLRAVTQRAQQALAALLANDKREDVRDDYARDNRRTHGESTQGNLLALIGCNVPGGSSPEPQEHLASYRWRDTAGVTDFADGPLAGEPVVKRQLVSGDDNFIIDVHTDNVVLPAHWEGALHAGATRSYEQWRRWLGGSKLVRTHIRLRFVGDAGRFAEIYGKPNQEGWATTGFYRVRDNEALILYTPAQRRSALGTAFHEMSHLITAWHLGATPPWLNEGIAEYFETMRVNWQQAAFTDNQSHLRLLKARGPVPLNALTTITRQEWGRKDPLLRYASAWSLIAFMLDTPEGVKTLQHVIERAHDQRCELQSELQTALQRYPGGATALETAWQQWIRES